MSNLGYLSTPEQVTPRQNVQYSQISNSFENLPLFWLSASLNNLLVSERKYLKSFNPSDLRARSLNDLDLLNLKPSKYTAFPNQYVQEQRK